MRVVLAVTSLSLLLGAPALPTCADPLMLAPDLESCIRDNAAKVEVVEPDLNRAVDFLVSNVCAVPLANDGETRAKQMLAQQKVQTQAACDKMKSTGAKPTGEDDYDPCSLVDLPDMTAAYTTMFQNAGNRPAAATALAAKLLLDLRLSHSKPGYTN